MSTIQATTYQGTVLSVPEHWNVLLAGGRGGGKSYATLLAVLRHVEKYGKRASVLIVRETHKAVSEIEEGLAELLHSAYGRGVRHNRADHVFRLPNGSRIECGQLEKPGDYKKYQGRSITLLVVEEFGLLKDRRWVELLKSNLRAAEGVPLREVRTANPGGSQHAYLHQKFIAATTPWHPFEVDGETWVHCPSVYTDNPHLDHDDYARRIRAACGQDEELARAWLAGDWNIARGAYFAGVLDERAHMLPPTWPDFEWDRRAWRPFVALDWGSASPSVCFLVLRAPGGKGRAPDGRLFPKDSLILVDEVASYDPEDLNLGLNWPPGKLAEAIKDMCARWQVPSVQGVGDDARGLEVSLLQVLRDHGVYLNRPRKERIAGWQKMREMLTHARDGSDQPGLWVSSRCRYFWQTVPFVERDPSRPEDLVTAGPDHAADAARYACLHAGNITRPAQTSGWF